MVCSEQTGRQNKVLLTVDERIRSYESSSGSYCNEAESNRNGKDRLRISEVHNCQSEKQGWKRKQYIHCHHQYCFGLAPQVASSDTNGSADNAAE